MMENVKNNNQGGSTPQYVTTDTERHTTAFEYSYPAVDVGGDDTETESNKSTPYYTPLEFFQSSFEFPSPKTEKPQNTDYMEFSTVARSTPPATASAVGFKRRFSLNERRSCSPQPQQLAMRSVTTCIENNVTKADSHVDDKENAKPKFADKREDNVALLAANSGNNSPIAILDEGGIRSPKVLTTNEASMMASGRLTYSPKLLASLNNLNLSGSPLGVISSAGYKNGNYFKFPEIDHVVQEHFATDAAQTEDQTVSGHCDNQHQLRSRQRNIGKLGHSSSSILLAAYPKTRFKSTSLDMENARVLTPYSDENTTEVTLSGVDMGGSVASSSSMRADSKRNRKNKNNLTIKITDIPPLGAHLPPPSPTPSPSPKPKTPTIKSTKEKALSLDSAAIASELTIIVSDRCDSHVSCDELDSSAQKLNMAQSRLTTSNVRPDAGPLRQVVSNRSTSLSQLASFADPTYPYGAFPSVSTTSALGQRLGDIAVCSNSGLTRTPRRRITGPAPNSDWLHYHRKQQHFHLNPNKSSESALSSLVSDTAEGGVKYMLDMGEAVVLKEADEVQGSDTSGALCPKRIQSASSHANASKSNPTSLTATPHRGSHKHNPLLHASNTNLKTLPELLTLVEFTSGGDGGSVKDDDYHAHKQKSMDLPSANTSVMARSKSTASASTSSTNLLQRRGSNHSLTLNLHGSCSNLLGSCRSGLSVSNYSLGAVAISSTNLNSKSSCNLDISTSNCSATQQAHHSAKHHAGVGVATNTQGAKQSLFRRRGSNHSLTLTNLSATSCGNLNSFASQNCLNVERAHTQAQSLYAGGVTRTTSFVTPTHNTPSNTTPKRGLLERRGSNQSLTLNMGSSFGGIGSDRNVLVTSNSYLGDTYPYVEESDQKMLHLPTCCAASAHQQQRKFFSSENLNRVNTQFADLNQAHKRNANQVCFGSVSDLKPTPDAQQCKQLGSATKREHFDFEESTVCTCTGVRNIMTRPLSPQTTSEEFKIYLANIQMLQNASNALNQIDLIKLNYIFDNSYTSSNRISLTDQPPMPVLSVSMRSKDAETPPGSGGGLQSTSEDCEVAERYYHTVKAELEAVQPTADEQKRIFCDLHKEFWDLPPNHQEKPMVFGSQAKNRYKTILPNENSRVLLEKECKLLAESVVDELPQSIAQAVYADEVPYINANYIKGPDYTSKCYIATQGPLPNTIYEFWLMVYQNTRRHFQKSEVASSPQQCSHAQISQQYCQKIVMLTNFLENNRQKCSIYFPVDLNEIFISTGQQQVLSPTPFALEFLSAYLKPGESENTKLDTSARAQQTHCFGVESFKATLTPSDVAKLQLPLAVNYFVIKNIGIVRKNGFSIRKLIVLYCVNVPSSDDRARLVLVHRFYSYHYWYPDWPDHRSPRDINTLLDICLHILNLGKCETEFQAYSECTTPIHMDAQPVELYQQDIFNATQPFPVIHCSAGIGRTGCLTAILNGVRQLRQSFAYSLTSMAATATKESSLSSTSQMLSPVDFCLPASFLEEARRSGVELTNDTDSSFTRNTLVYIDFILKVRRRTPKAASEGVDADPEHHTPVALTDSERFRWQLPTLAELPKMPDIFVDVLGIVCNLRLQRGGMVQNSEQYELIHRAICLYLKRTFALKRF